MAKNAKNSSTADDSIPDTANADGTPSDRTDEGGQGGNSVQQTQEALDRIQARIDQINAKIEEGIEGDTGWLKTILASMKQELADLQANQQNLTENLAAQVADLKAQLTPLQQEILGLKTSRQQSEPREPGDTETVVSVKPALSKEPKQDAPKARNRVV